ncbi:MAG: hypothetical protein HYY17_16795 [Planctomycetes bacterium]|nr:hypothetical protein [Planctomycetota bacterium]
MRAVLAALAVLAGTGAVASPSDEWSEYGCEKYGFTMLVPKGTEWAEKEYENGWGGLYARTEDAEFFGIARLGTWTSLEEIERFGVEATGVPAEAWKKIDAGKDKGGWREYRTYGCEHEGVVVFAAVGTGPSGSYLLFLKTTAECAQKNAKQYETWYRNVKLGPSTVAGKGWTVYECEKYAFSMLAPQGTKFAEKEFEGGWGLLAAKHEGVQLWGLAKLGHDYSHDDIAKLGIKLTGIAADHWKEIDAGENKLGWKWYRVFAASDGEDLVFGGYGVGSKAGYLLVLKTTVKDFEKHEKDYMKWYRSAVVR